MTRRTELELLEAKLREHPFGWRYMEHNEQDEDCLWHTEMRLFEEAIALGETGARLFRQYERGAQ